MFPELDPGMGLGAQRGQTTKWCAIAQGRQDRAGSKVDTNADHRGGINTTLLQDCGNRVFEHRNIIIRILQCPVGRQRFGAAGQVLIDHTAGVGMDRRRDFAAVGHINQQRAPRFGAKVNADGVGWRHHVTPLLCTA